MKSAIKNLLAIILTVIISLGATSISTAKEANKVTVLTSIKNISKLNVSGNVEVILIQSPTESVKVYDSYYSKNALVQQKNDELRISSFDKETLTVVVYANSLTEITVADNAIVKTDGKFSTLSLAITLKDRAKANLNTNTIDLSTNVSGQANLTISGSSNDYNAVIDSVATLNMDKFTAENSSIQSKNQVMAKKATVVNELPTTDDLVTF